MTERKWALRAAVPEDAGALVDFILMAGDGVPEYLWRSMAGPNESPRDVGARRARRDEGGFSWRNAVIAESADGEAVAGLIGYPLPDAPDPVDLEGVPPLVRPLLALEAQVPGSWYVNVIATRPEWRRQGLAQALMDLAEKRAHETARRALGLVVSSDRRAARALYEARGFAAIATLPKAGDGPLQGGAEWVLYRKPL